MTVAGGDAAFPEFGQHGGVVDAQVTADPREGPAEVVQLDGAQSRQRTNPAAGTERSRRGNTSSWGSAPDTLVSGQPGESQVCSVVAGQVEPIPVSGPWHSVLLTA